MTVICAHFATSDGRSGLVRGRAAWMLLKLADHGARGCSYTDTPAPRLSSYIHRLRRAGVPIRSVRERHGGDFPGHHSRYFLGPDVTVTRIESGERADLTPEAVRDRPTADMAERPS